MVQPDCTASRNQHSVYCLEITLPVNQTAQSGYPIHLHDTPEYSTADMVPTLIGHGQTTDLVQFPKRAA